MENKYKITIPKPCNENWDEMTPNENGRFCMSCSKTVVDFSSMFPEEIQHYFAKHQNEKICGRFKKSQLDSITIQIPNHILYAQTNYYKMFLLALFVAMGTTLFSCADKDGNKKKIHRVEIVENKKLEEITIEKEWSKDSISIPIPAMPKSIPVKFVKPRPIVCGEAFNDKDNSSTKINDQNTIAKDSIVEEGLYVMGAAIETTPTYPGGINSFYQFFVSEFKLPEDAENPKGRIVVNFVIEKDGSLSSFEFPKLVDPNIKSEIIRVLNLSPKWKSGEQNGKKTRTKYSFPIAIQS
jgi:hypothetical protein